MERTNHRHLADFLPFRRRPSLFSRKNYEASDQAWRLKENHGQCLDPSCSPSAACAKPLVYDEEALHQDTGYDWEQSTGTIEGLHTSYPRQGFDQEHQAEEYGHILPKRKTPKRTRSLHGLISAKPDDGKDTPWGSWKRGSNNRKESRQDLWESSKMVTLERSSGSPSAPCRWLRRCMSTTIGRRHRFQNTSGTTSSKPPLHGSPEMLPIPGIGVEPPQVPDSTTSGAAARAAAAAQNHVLRSLQSTRLAEPKISRDSESGIGIEVRDGVGENSETAIPVVRRDPAFALPEELIAQILSYLDAASLINAELVSRRWQISAGSNRIWRHVFHVEFDWQHQNHQIPSTAVQVGGQGLGRNIGDQDWKKMWRARKALQQRWMDGHAAAIYLEGHTDCVYCVQFDEHKILTGSRDRTVRVWDARTYECIRVLGVPSGHRPPIAPLPTNVTGRGQWPFDRVSSPSRTIELGSNSSAEHHSGSILCLQYDNQIIITGSSDSTLIMWDIQHDYQPIRRLRHHTAGVLDVCFDEKHIVSCSKDTTLCLWDRHTGEFLRSLSGHRGPVNAVQLRTNLVVSASGDGVAKLWNLTSGLCIKEFPSKDRGMACVEFSPDSRTILAGGNDQVIYQFDTNTGELVRELKGHKNLVRSLHLDSANGRIISGSYDASVRAYDMHTGDTIIDFTSWTTSWILSAKADYRRVVATSQDSRVVIMDFGYQLPGVASLEG